MPSPRPHVRMPILGLPSPAGLLTPITMSAILISAEPAQIPNNAPRNICGRRAGRSAILVAVDFHPSDPAPLTALSRQQRQRNGQGEGELHRRLPLQLSRIQMLRSIATSPIHATDIPIRHDSIGHEACTHHYSLLRRVFSLSTPANAPPTPHSAQWLKDEHADGNAERGRRHFVSMPWHGA